MGARQVSGGQAYLGLSVQYPDAKRPNEFAISGSGAGEIVEDLLIDRHPCIPATW